MEAKHTPGPWTLEETTNADGAGEYEVEAVDYETVALVYASESLAANAALIAAAPELLFAAIAALDCLERPHAERDENRVRVMLDVAIARAEGK